MFHVRLIAVLMFAAVSAALSLTTAIALEAISVPLDGRTLDDVRTPHRNNWDFVVSKDVRFKGNVRGELKFEVLNLTDTVKTTGPITQVGSTTFGQISTQTLNSMIVPSQAPVPITMW